MKQPPVSLRNVTSYRVIYGDTDQMGVVYYANFLRWFERGRSEFLRELGTPYAIVESRGFHFPVTEVSCRYVKPAHYDDLIVIETRLTSLARATLSFSYQILEGEKNSPLATGFTRHACVDGQGRVVRIPADLQALFQAAVTPAQSRALDG